MEKRGKAPAWAIIVSVLLCIIICIASVIFMLFLSGRLLLTKVGIKQLINSTVSDEFHGAIQDAKDDIADIVGVDREVFDDREADELITETATSVLNFILTGEGDAVDPQIYIDYIEKHEDEIEDTMGHKIDDDFYEELEEELEAFNEEIKESYEEEFENDPDMEIIRTITSPKAVLIPALIIAGLIAIVFAVYNKYIDGSFISIGITCIVAGVITGGFALLELLMIMAIDDEVFSLIFDIIKNNTFMEAAVSVVLGIILIVCGNMIKKQLKALEDDGFGTTNSTLENKLDL